MVNILIAITGNKGSGKDTFAKALINKHPKFKNVKIAKTLKEITKLIYEIDDTELENPETKEKYRKVMQYLGTDVLQSEFFGGKKFQIEKCLRECKRDDAVVITDLRFLHEAEEIKKLGGIIIKIERESKMQLDTHISETELELIKPDFVFVNDGDLIKFDEFIEFELNVNLIKLNGTQPQKLNSNSH